MKQRRQPAGHPGAMPSRASPNVDAVGWDRLEVFLAVATTGSLSAAARSLSLAQPTVRRGIAALERTLGVVLFRRGTHGLVLTEEGRRALVYADSMQATARALGRAVTGSSDRADGRVRLTASRVVAVEVLPTILEPLVHAHPGLTIEVVATNSIEDLLRHDADVAIRMTRPTQKALVATRVAEVPIGVFAHRRYVDASDGPPPWSASRLARQDWIVGDRDTSLVDALARLGIEPAATSLRFRSDDDLVQLAALRAALGVGAAQLAIASRDSQLVDVAPSLRVSLEAWIVTHEDLRGSHKVRVVFDHLRDALREYWQAPRDDRAGGAPSGTPRAATRRPAERASGGAKASTATPSKRSRGAPATRRAK